MNKIETLLSYQSLHNTEQAYPAIANIRNVSVIFFRRSLYPGVPLTLLSLSLYLSLSLSLSLSTPLPRSRRRRLSPCRPLSPQESVPPSPPLSRNRSHSPSPTPLSPSPLSPVPKVRSVSALLFIGRPGICLPRVRRLQTRLSGQSRASSRSG